MRKAFYTYLITLIFTVVNTGGLLAQTSYHITTSQGLATHQLTILIKDKKNNMWFGSYNGLHKHEGTSIKVYGKSGKDASSLSSKEIHPVFEDRHGFIWAGTTGGLDKLDPYQDTIHHYKIKDSSRDDDFIGYIYSIFQDNKDDIWFTTDVGMFVLDYRVGTYKRIPDKVKTGDGLPEYEMGYKGRQATKDGIWMVPHGHPAFFDYRTKQFYHRFNNPQHKKIFDVGGNSNSDANTDMCIDSSSNIYFIANNTYLVKYNLKTEKIDSFQFVFPKDAWRCCYSLAVDYKGNIWIGFRYGGLLLFNNTTQQFTAIRYQDANSVIGSNYVYSLCEDYMHRMWVATNNGIFVIDYYDHSVQQKYLSNNIAYTNINYTSGIISQDEKENLYIPYYLGGLFQYNTHSATTRHFAVTDSAAGGYGYVFTGQKNKFFIGNGKTLMEADTIKHEITLHPPKDSLYKALATYRGSVIWIYKKDERKIYYKKSNGRIYYYNGTNRLEVLLSQGFMKQACVSKDKQFLYFLNEAGNLVRRNLSTLNMDTITIVDKIRKLDFSYTITMDLADDGKGNIWITSQNGLIKYNSASDSIFVYTTSNGLLHDFTFSLCSDTENRLWVGSMGGVNLYDEKNNSFINVFPESPDKLSNYFGSSLQGQDGHIYFVFGGKLVNIDPVEFLGKHATERILNLNDVQVNGVPTDNTFKLLDNLSYTQNRIYFRFGLLEFTEPEKIKYFYMLQGLDTSWTDAGNRSDVTFNSLQPGKYDLRVKAKDIYGNEVRQQLSIPFTIHPPFYKTWWAKVISILLICLIVYWFIRQKQNKINHQKEELEIEQSINYFSTVMHGQKNIDEMLWSVTKNCISKLGFMDCVIYLVDEERNVLVQKAAHGPKNPREFEIYNPVEIPIGKGIVGSVAANGKGELIKDTSKDSRYLVDDEMRIAEIAVPIVYEGKTLGVIDSEDSRKSYFKEKHLSILNNIASICAIKIVAILAEENKQQALLKLVDQKRVLAGLEIKALRAQMNPHFIFNALNSIQQFSMQNDFNNANKYISRFSKVLRMALHQSEHSKIKLSAEIEMLEIYLEIEALRLGTLFTYHFELDDEVESEAVNIPSMMIQPIVENALKHGLSNKVGERKIWIIFQMIDDVFLKCIVEDNGIGRERAGELNISRSELMPHQSMGIKLVKERLAIFHGEEKEASEILITDLKDENGNATGTRVEIILPVD